MKTRRAFGGTAGPRRPPVDARAVLDHYGVENAREETTRSGEVEVVHSCLLDRVERHHANGDANPSASCNVDRGLYICYAHWGGGMLGLIQRMEGLPDLDSAASFASRFATDGHATDTTTFVAEIEAAMAPPKVAPSAPECYSRRVLEPWAFVHPYLAERGVDAETASRLRIGWREDDNRIIVPHFWEGRLVGWQARSVPHRPGSWPGSPRQSPKYLSTPGFPRSTTLYHDHSSPMPVSGPAAVLVESPMSVVKAVALGVGHPVFATFGCKVSPAQASMLSGFDRVYLWPDGDGAGRAMAATVSRLMSWHPGLMVVEPEEGRDLGDHHDLAEVVAKLDSAEPASLWRGTGVP